MASSENFVAKYNWQVNKAKTFTDRKKAMKKRLSKTQICDLFHLIIIKNSI